jgi:HK97 family phage portal protein
MFDFTARATSLSKKSPTSIDIVGPGQAHRLFGHRIEEMSSGQMRRAYRSIVATLIDFRARKFAPQMHDMKVVRKVEQNEMEDVEPDHPWVGLLGSPSPLIPATLFYQVCFKLIDSQGHVDLVPIYEEQMGRLVPQSLRILYPEWGYVLPSYDQKGEVESWHYYRKGGGRETLPPRSIIRIKEPHPTAPFRTAGKLEAAAYEIDEHAANNVFSRDKARGKGRPQVILRDESIESASEARKLAREFSQQYHQRTDRIPVERGGMEIEQVDVTPAEMEFLESRKFTVDQLMAIFEIPKGMLSSEDSATGKGRAGAKRQFEEDTVQPKIRTTTEQLGHNLRRIFDAGGSNLALKAPDVVTMPPDKRLGMHLKRIKTGTPPNRILRERGEEEVDGGDTPMIDGALQSLQAATSGLA